MTEAMQLRKQNSGGFGSSGSSQENLSNVMYNAANYNTIMVEYANGDREMAVDVPASFIAQAKVISLTLASASWRQEVETVQKLTKHMY